MPDVSIVGACQTKGLRLHLSVDSVMGPLAVSLPQVEYHPMERGTNKKDNRFVPHYVHECPTGVGGNSQRLFLRWWLVWTCGRAHALCDDLRRRFDTLYERWAAAV